MPSFNGCLQITSFLCFLPRCTSPRTVLNCGILQHFSNLGTRWTHKLRVVIACPALCIYVFYVFSAHVNHIANKQYDIQYTDSETLIAFCYLQQLLRLRHHWHVLGKGFLKFGSKTLLKPSFSAQTLDLYRVLHSVAKLSPFLSLPFQLPCTMYT